MGDVGLEKFVKHSLYCCWVRPEGYYDRSLGCTCGLEDALRKWRHHGSPITGELLLRYNFKRSTYYLTHGPETFYDEDDTLIEFDNEEEARQWAVANLGMDPRFPSQSPKTKKEKPRDDRQPTLF